MTRRVAIVLDDGTVLRGASAQDEAARSGRAVVLEVDYPDDGREEPAEVAELAAALSGDVAKLGEEGRREDLGALAERVRGTPEEAAVLMAIREQLDERLTELGVRP